MKTEINPDPKFTCTCPKRDALDIQMRRECIDWWCPVHGMLALFLVEEKRMLDEKKGSNDSA